MKFARYVRHKRKPPKDATCDGHVGADYSQKTPRVLRCTSPATVEMKGGPFGHEMWVCEGCARAQEQRDAKEADDDER